MLGISCFTRKERKKTWPILVLVWIETRKLFATFMLCWHNMHSVCVFFSFLLKMKCEWHAMVHVIFYVCFDGHTSQLNFFLSLFMCFFFTLFFFCSHLVLTWLKAESSRVSCLFTHTRTRTDVYANQVYQVLATKMSTYPLYSHSLELFFFSNFVQVSRYTVDWFFLFTSSKRWIVCFVKSWNSLNRICSHHCVIFLSSFIIWLSFNDSIKKMGKKMTTISLESREQNRIDWWT